MEAINKNGLKTILDKLDLFICSSSFEDRCFVLPEVVKKFFPDCASLICYNSNEYQIIISNSHRIKDSLNNVSLLQLNSDDPISNTRLLNETLDKYLATSIDTIFLDTSTFTHETLLILIRLLSVKRSKYNNLYIGYVGAQEYSINERDQDKWLSTGISNIRSIIGYPGVHSPARESHLIVLFGFEDERTKELIELMQFNSISLGFGPEDDSILPNHYRINYARHTRLMSYFSQAYKFTFSLSDPFEAAQSLRKEIKKFSDKNIVIAPMNTKLSALGAALVAIENTKVQLIYAKAIQYNVTGYAKAKDDFYCYKLW